MEEGYFPRGSVLRRVHGARIVGLVYGQRALVVQAADPVAFAGLMSQTSGRATPFQRLAHTAKVMERVFLGSREEADRETERVRRMHARAGVDAAPLLLWILACLADSAEVTYETFVRRLSDSERARFWQDYLLVGELFGLDRAHAPATYGQYRDYMAQRLASPDLRVLPDAADICRTIIDELPVPAPERPIVQALHFLVVGMLPPRLREMYGFEWGRLRQRAYETMALAHRSGLPLVPRPLRRGSCAFNYDIVAREERRRLRAAVA